MKKTLTNTAHSRHARKAIEKYLEKKRFDTLYGDVFAER